MQMNHESYWRFWTIDSYSARYRNKIRLSATFQENACE